MRNKPHAKAAKAAKEEKEKGKEDYLLSLLFFLLCDLRGLCVRLIPHLEIY
jgi:hypothetical protein